MTDDIVHTSCHSAHMMIQRAGHFHARIALCIHLGFSCVESRISVAGDVPLLDISDSYLLCCKSATLQKSGETP